MNKLPHFNHFKCNNIQIIQKLNHHLIFIIFDQFINFVIFNYFHFHLIAKPSIILLILLDLQQHLKILRYFRFQNLNSFNLSFIYS